MIYFVQPTDGGPIKIGFSNDVDARIRELEVYYGRPLALLARMPGGREEERVIHDRFSHLRFGRTEQFRPAPELMTFIGRPLLVTPNPETIEAIIPAKSNYKTIGVRASAEWAQWLEELASFDRVNVASLVDRAVAHYAKHINFVKPPPDR